MAERSDQIEKLIESARSDLGNNLHELEYKVKQAADWRTHFERNPTAIMGLAFGGGVLLAAMLGPKDSDSHMAPPGHDRGRSTPDGTRRKSRSDTRDTLKSAAMGFAALKVRKVLNDALPGFGEQFEKAEREVSAGGSHPHTYDRDRESAHRI
jgi:hypothetical protein